MRSMLIKPLMMILIIQLVVPAHLWAEDPESTTWPKKVHLQEFRKWAWKEKIPLLPHRALCSFDDFNGIASAEFLHGKDFS